MIVLGADVAWEAILGTPTGMACRGLICRREKIIVPPAYAQNITEFCVALCTAQRSDLKRALVLQRAALQLPDETRWLEGVLAEKTLITATVEGICASDAQYIALALMANATLFTLSDALRSVCRKNRIACIEEIDL